MSRHRRGRNIGEGCIGALGLPSAPDRDCLNPDDVKKIIKALRQVWSWSHSRRLVIKRCDLGEGYSRCESCRKKVPKVHVDHVTAVGTFDDGYIRRLFVSSNLMQGLCVLCHKIKTKKDLAAIKAKKVVSEQEDFF